MPKSKDKFYQKLEIHLKNYLNSFKIDNYIKFENNIESGLDFDTITVFAKSKDELNELKLSLIIKENKSLINFRVYRISSIVQNAGMIRIEDYLEKIVKIGNFKSNFSLSNNLETLDAELKQFFEWLTSVTDAQLINILQGKDWVDIPFDWGGYK